MLQFTKVLFKWGQAVDATSDGWIDVLVKMTGKQCLRYTIHAKLNKVKDNMAFLHSFNAVSEWSSFIAYQKKNAGKTVS